MKPWFISHVPTFSQFSRLTGKTKFSVKVGLRSANVSDVGEHLLWLLSSGKRQILKSKENEGSVFLDTFQT